MTNNHAVVNFVQPSIPIVQGNNYDIWSTKMKTLVYFSRFMGFEIRNDCNEDGEAADNVRDL